MGFCRVLDLLGRFSTKTFLRVLFKIITFGTTPVLRDGLNQSYSRDNHGVEFNCYRLYTTDPNLYEKISIYSFFRKVSTVNPIEMKQETVRPRPEGKEVPETRLHGSGLIQLGKGEDGHDWSSSHNGHNGELDLIDPTRRWASWKWFIQLAPQRFGSVGPTRRRASWPWLIQLLRWSVGVGSVVPMLGNCSFDGLIDPLRRTCRVIILRIRSFVLSYSHYIFRNVSRDLFDIGFVVTDFDPNIFRRLYWTTIDLIRSQRIHRKLLIRSIYNTRGRAPAHARGCGWSCCSMPMYPCVVFVAFGVLLWSLVLHDLYVL